MRTTAQFCDPGSMEIKVSIEMSLKEWSELLIDLKNKDLNNKWPLSRIHSEIGDVIYQVEKKFYAQTEDGK